MPQSRLAKDPLAKTFAEFMAYVEDNNIKALVATLGDEKVRAGPSGKGGPV